MSTVHAVNNYKGSIYMVSDYMDHDLTGLMERCKYKFEVGQVRSGEPFINSCTRGGRSWVYQ